MSAAEINTIIIRDSFLPLTCLQPQSEFSLPVPKLTRLMNLMFLLSDLGQGVLVRFTLHT